MPAAAVAAVDRGHHNLMAVQVGRRRRRRRRMRLRLLRLVERRGPVDVDGVVVQAAACDSAASIPAAVRGGRDVVEAGVGAAVGAVGVVVPGGGAAVGAAEPAAGGAADGGGGGRPDVHAVGGGGGLAADAGPGGGAAVVDALHGVHVRVDRLGEQPVGAAQRRRRRVAVLLLLVLLRVWRG